MPSPRWLNSAAIEADLQTVFRQIALCFDQKTFLDNAFEFLKRLLMR